MSAFADRLIEAIRAKGTPAMVGLDHLPEPFRSRATGSAAEAAGILANLLRG